MDYNGEDDIDHINHDGLDNRKKNLRIVPHKVNLLNQHNEDNGVYQVASGRYRSAICIDGKTIHLGTFDTFQDAKKARVNYENALNIF